MILVLTATAIAFVLGLTFLLGASTTVGVAQMIDDHARARQIAESGLDIVVAYLQQTPEWHVHRQPGPWISHFELLGGTVSVNGYFDEGAVEDSLAVDNSSYELAVGQLGSPLLFPPMSGTISNWHMQRNGVNLTGLTVPAMGVQHSAHATDGDRLAYIVFVAGVLASGTISQTLSESLEPNTNYALCVDVGKAGLANVLADVQIRVLAGGTVIASSQNPTLLQLLDLGNDFHRYTLRFTTDHAPPAGLLRIELSASSILGVVAGVAFDNVHLDIESNAPVTLTALGRYGQATHKLTAMVDPRDVGENARLRIIQWSEP